MRDPRNMTGKGEQRERGTGLGEVGRCERPACEKLRGRSGPGAAGRAGGGRRRLWAPPGSGVVGPGAADLFPGPCFHACGRGQEAGARPLPRPPRGKARWSRASSSAPAIGGSRAALTGPGGREESLIRGGRVAPGFDRARRGTDPPPPTPQSSATPRVGAGAAPPPALPARRGATAPRPALPRPSSGGRRRAQELRGARRPPRRGRGRRLAALPPAGPRPSPRLSPSAPARPA